MRKLVFGLVYTALMAGANTAWAAGPDILSMRTGDMKKLIVHETPQATSDATFILADDAGTGSLADYRGKYVLVNFWATWCAPCRKEMPQLNALQKEFGGDHFEVLTIAAGRNSPAGISKFFKEAGIDSLPRHQDPKQALASQMGVFGLPITVLIDPKGREIARLRGDAKWDSDSAKAIVKALITSQTEE
ncbi:TlpA family protein disulfide reductase [Sulfitobacter sp. M57]|uniref:TlpA disulfide reductase family protein n=1 Tax=unclassified Sulfitobacter TaxID=196795 RepID=UPI0023E2D9F2|nr:MULTISPECIES: TlpA disulfide reductase family protein [unclassified Sulfitobacter]MDF3412839.1 TlpA family protein disulfide reductase [Sulfitobacter sp. KE5]MDF3421877.1 TlpA family protein disulfide reductase [Sulfitobacter sp. KE43]MDF3431388.1 TlpA family protein disulfide reductase [Sulfitobacter sp. KE42]MDF3457029.1 TlpA family protein disulfide reductase [Sulfitobacter sp. S74]MDF3460932.1 TlpA family protein disulfide reductase [Sulfitobacter sp. Ks18]